LANIETGKFLVNDWCFDFYCVGLMFGQNQSTTRQNLQQIKTIAIFSDKCKPYSLMRTVLDHLKVYLKNFSI